MHIRDPNRKMPPVEGGEHIVKAWQECGLCLMMMSPVSLTWQELQSYNTINHNQLDGWELSLVRQMSDAYVSGLHQYSENVKSPYQREFDEEDMQGLVIAQMAAIDGCIDEVEEMKKPF